MSLTKRHTVVNNLAPLHIDPERSRLKVLSIIIFGFMLVLTLSAGVQQLTSTVNAKGKAPDRCGICIVYDDETGQQHTYLYYDPLSSVTDFCPCDC